MTNDHFWKRFWILAASTIIVCVVGGASLFFIYVGKAQSADVGVDFNADKDPFQSSLRKSDLSLTDGTLYKDALPLGVNAWDWDTTLNWRSTGQVFDGVASLKASFTQPWAGLGVSGFSIDVNVNKTLTLSVDPDSNTGDLYVELYDKKGVPLGRQSLGWYAPGGALVANQWQTISIPIQNLLGSSTTNTITAFALSTTNAGTAYIDDIQFTKTPTVHVAWVYKVPEGYTEPPFNPFATSTSVSLPYSLTFSPYPLNPSPFPDDQWYAPRGRFTQDYDAFRLGPKKGVNSDAVALLRGGRSWADYQVSATVTWGSAAVFSLIVRMQDENNYASCSFSYSADTIQMYVVKNGISEEVAQSDKLHYSDYIGGANDIGAIVHGRTLSCSSGGKQIISQDISTMPGRGTVGIGAWDANDAATPHTMTAFAVQPLAGE